MTKLHPGQTLALALLMVSTIGTAMCKLEAATCLAISYRMEDTGYSAHL